MLKSSVCLLCSADETYEAFPIVLSLGKISEENLVINYTIYRSPRNGKKTNVFWKSHKENFLLNHFLMGHLKVIL